MIATDLSIRKDEGRYKVTFYTDNRSAIDEILSLEEPIVATFKKARKRRSQDSNAYMWVLCDRIADVLHSTKEEVYVHAIRQVGVFEDVAVQVGAVRDLVHIWTSRGIGWKADIFDSTLKGCKRIRLYTGSHVYNSKQMSRLIDYLVEEAKGLGIETLTDTELQRLLEESYDISSRKDKELHSDEQSSSAE